MRLWPRRQGSSLDLLVVGLGNPGREYARNRHNAGYLVVDELARRHNGSWRAEFSPAAAQIRPPREPPPPLPPPARPYAARAAPRAPAPLRPRPAPRLPT